MKKIILFILICAISACTTITTKNKNSEFFLKFGILDDYDAEKWSISYATNTIPWKKGEVENFYGVYIERKKPKKYAASFKVYKYNAITGDKSLVEESPKWLIHPPNNDDYSTFLLHAFDGDVDYGKYQFEVYVDFNLYHSFDYYVTKPNG